MEELITNDLFGCCVYYFLLLLCVQDDSDRLSKTEYIFYSVNVKRLLYSDISAFFLHQQQMITSCEFLNCHNFEIRRTKLLKSHKKNKNLLVHTLEHVKYFSRKLLNYPFDGLQIDLKTIIMHFIYGTTDVLL